MAASIQFGNIYYNAASLRLSGLTVNNKESKVIRWFYRKDGTTDWTEVTAEKQTIAVGNATEYSSWCHIPRGKLSADTAYDFKCTVDYSGTTETKRYYSTQRTLRRVFSVNATGSVLSKVKLIPVASLGNAKKLYVFKALDSAVRALVTADAWEFVGSANITTAANTAGYTFSTREDYKKYDFKVILVDQYGFVSDIIFIED